jgi:GNAT superfamily N-acetyltransferase
VTARITAIDDASETDVDQLATLLSDCADTGASVGFLAPLPHDLAATWWRATLGSPGTRTWVARDDDGLIVGCVRLTPATMPNSPHRGDVSKLLVALGSRGAGLAGRLMETLEQDARGRGLTLLMLDTETGSPAQGFYQRRGWELIGTVPDYALSATGELAPTTILAKRLAP